MGYGERENKVVELKVLAICFARQVNTVNVEDVHQLDLMTIQLLQFDPRWSCLPS